MYINKDELLNYLEKEFPEPMRNGFTRDMVGNIIDWIEIHCDGLDEAHEMIVNIIPDVTMEEIDPFMNYIPFNQAQNDDFVKNRRK